MRALELQPEPMRQRRADGAAALSKAEAGEEDQPLLKATNGPHKPPYASRQDVMQRCRPQLAYAVYAIFVLVPIAEHHLPLPAFIWQALIVAGLGYLLYRILIFKRWGDEYAAVPRFLWCFVLMIIELCFENVMVWIVSATDKRKYDDPPGLQDNIEIAFGWLGEQNAFLHWLLWYKWANTMHFLGVALCLAFSVAWDQIPYSGFGVMSRYCLTICLGRLIRVASFMSTVLPSPRPGCYSQRFPPPPDTLWGILKVGATSMRGFGGCNDLVFSGHGAFWTLAPLLFQYYYPGHRATCLMWAALVQTSIRDVLEKQHYGVDMVLAPVVTWAVWSWLEWVYPPSKPLQKRPEGAKADPLSPYVIALIVVAVGAGAIIVFIGKA